MSDEALERIVAAVRQSPKHSRICEEFVRHIGADELPKRRNLKAAIKSTKNKLHQVGGAYLDGNMSYDTWLESLSRAAQSSTPDDLRVACRAVMSHHASTSERLTVLDDFYSTVLADLAPVESVVDIACGLNPLAIPWMPLAPDAAYIAYDIYHDMIDFVSAFMRLPGVQGQALARDVSQFVPPERVDVALILKTIPCLEQVDKAAGQHLLESVRADYVLVSFPVRSLGGRARGMVETYDAHLHALIADRNWPVQRFEFETELAFLVDKRQG